MKVEGAVEDTSGDVVVGWAVDTEHPGIPVALDVLLGATVIDRILTSNLMMEMSNVRHESGTHGFTYHVPNGVDASLLAFRPCGSRTLIDNSWIVRRLEGRIEHYSHGTISGWALDLNSPSASVEVQVFFEGLEIATGIASGLRPDVAQIFSGSGRVAFSIPLPPGTDQSRIEVKEATSGIALQPTSEFAELYLPLIGSFDGLTGKVAVGWAYDEGRPATVDFHVAGRLVGSAVASSYRADVEAAGFGDGRCGFQAELDLDMTTSEFLVVTATLQRTGRGLRNSPRRFELPALARAWLARTDRATGPLLNKIRRWCNFRAGDKTLSIVMPVYETPEAWLREALDSVLAQWCGKWQLVCVNDASPSPHVGAVLAEYADRDARVTVVSLTSNGGIASAVNAGLRAASGNYVTFMDHDDVLKPDASYWLLRAAVSGVDLIYTDEFLTGGSSSALTKLAARPIFCYDYYLSHPYFVHLICIRRALSEALGGWNESMSISGDVDFVSQGNRNGRNCCSRRSASLQMAYPPRERRARICQRGYGSHP